MYVIYSLWLSMFNHKSSQIKNSQSNFTGSPLTAPFKCKPYFQTCILLLSNKNNLYPPLYKYTVYVEGQNETEVDMNFTMGTEN